jgi:hypothetical protein
MSSPGGGAALLACTDPSRTPRTPGDRIEQGWPGEAVVLDPALGGLRAVCNAQPRDLRNAASGTGRRRPRERTLCGPGHGLWVTRESPVNAGVDGRGFRPRTLEEILAAL